jgi:subtilase-type serine protease
LDQVEGGIGTRAQLYGIAYHGFTIAPAVDLAYGRLGGDVALPVGFDLLGSELQANTDIGRNVFRAGAQLDVMRFDELVGGFLAYDGRFQQNAQNNTFSGGILVRF